MSRHEYANGLRRLADYIEFDADPRIADRVRPVGIDIPADSREEFLLLALSLPETAEAVTTDSFHVTRARFGPHQLDLYIRVKPDPHPALSSPGAEILMSDIHE